jgi:uncharacterized membrane protein
MNASAQDETERAPPPQVARIAAGDILAAIADGMRDMQAAPALSLSFGLAAAGFGWLILILAAAMQWGAYAYPLATGFPLVAPMAAAGLYEISRRIGQGARPSWSDVAGVVAGRNGQSVRIMAVVTTFIYIIWIDIAAALYVAFFGLKALGPAALLKAAFTTAHGFAFLLIGNLAGAAIAVTVFAIMAVSLPLLFDREVDFVTAMIVSARTVIANPIPMLMWCAIIGVLLALSLASLFVGLIAVFPLLGHASWHVYRRAVLPA